MAVCDYLVQKDIEVNCTDPLVQGVEAEGVIINRQDIDFSAVTYDTTKANIIKTIALKTGKKGYRVVQGGNSPFTGTKTELTTGTYRNTFTNTVSLVVLDNDPDVCKDIIDGLANGSFVVILENKYKGLNKENPGEGAFQVYGWAQGLMASEITNEKYSEDTDGGWLVNLQEAKAPRAGMFMFTTDYETTKTAVDTLTKDAV